MNIKLINYGFDEAPYRAHHNDAGADLYAPEDVTIPPTSVYSMGLKLGIALPDGYVGFVFPRSSLSAKGLTAELPPIDSGYRGEIHAVLTNNTTEPYHIKKGERVGQLVILPVIIPTFVEDIDEDERGTGAFGSTGK